MQSKSVDDLYYEIDFDPTVLKDHEWTDIEKLAKRYFDLKVYKFYSEAIINAYIEYMSTTGLEIRRKENRKVSLDVSKH